MKSRRTTAACCLLLAGLFSSLGAPALAARPAPAPKPAPAEPPAKETLIWGDRELLVERAATATAKDLQLPFYAGAKLREGRTYQVSTKEGEQLDYLAAAVLTTKDKAEKVAAWYSQRLPGKPKPTTIQDKTGKRLVLAVAAGKETRSVTLLPTKTGCEVHLTRAVKHADTPPLPKPQIVTPRQPETRRGPGGGGRGRRGPGGGRRSGRGVPV